MGKHTICNIENCEKLACWGIERNTRCGLHKEPNDINTANRSKKCKGDNCNVKPSYGLEKNKPMYCTTHKLENMWQVCTKICLEENCKITAGYGIDKNKPLNCFLHKKENQIYVLKKKKCLHEECDKIPMFGKVNGIAEYCKEHKLENYIDINHKKCLFENCNKRPTYGKINTKEAEYCVNHKPDDYIDILNKRCEHPDCNKFPNYGLVSGIALSCLDHKKENYIRSFEEQIKERYHKNKNTDKYIKQRKNFYENNKDKLYIKQKIYYNNKYLLQLVYKCNSRAKVKQFNCDISLDFIYYKLEKQNNKCVYCECNLDLIADIGNRKMDLISVDRIKSNIGYIMGNIQLTCMFCNYAKNNFTDEQYKDFIKCLKTKDNSLFHINHNKKVNYKYVMNKKQNGITLEWLQNKLDEQNWKCYYSGLELLPNIKDNKSPYQVSIERLDCNVRYEPDNCVIVCLSLNYGRNNSDIESFKNHLADICNHN